MKFEEGRVYIHKNGSKILCLRTYSSQPNSFGGPNYYYKLSDKPEKGFFESKSRFESRLKDWNAFNERADRLGAEQKALEEQNLGTWADVRFPNGQCEVLEITEIEKEDG